MYTHATVLIALVAVSCVAQTSGPPIPASPQEASREAQKTQKVELTVPAGTPLRLYLTKRIPKKLGVPVEAKLLAPVYSFDRQVIPAETVVLGNVNRLEPVGKSQRAQAILGGDFTPLRVAQVEFTVLKMAGGATIPMHTIESPGLNTLVPLNPPKPKKGKPSGSTGGVLGTGKRTVQDQINAQIAAVKSIPNLVRGPNRKERLSDFVMSKLPYHPQYVRNRTRFDAELTAPLDFGPGTIKADSLALLGSQPPADCIAHARLVTPLGSGSSQLGEAVEAVLTEPLFTSEHKLLLPEGARVDGSVVAVRKARWFHRSGQLRFNLQTLDLTPALARLEPVVVERSTFESTAKTSPSEPRGLKQRTQATLEAAESGNASQLKIDEEGGVQAKESKKRFISLAISMMIARAAADNDPVRDSSGAVVGQSSNVGGRTLGGASGFGLLGMAAAQSSRYVGAAFGYYGMAWSFYSTVIARGGEVEFGKNATIDIRFNTRTPAHTEKFRAGM